MKTIKQIYYEYLQKNKQDKAVKLAYLDAIFDKASWEWQDETFKDQHGNERKKERPLEFVSIENLEKPNKYCGWCKTLVNEETAVLQRGYWSSHSLKLYHNDCLKEGHQWDVHQQQLIDMDCNECKHFSALLPTIHGSRLGKCLKLNKQTYAFPGGTFCNAGIHDDCFEHRNQ